MAETTPVVCDVALESETASQTQESTELMLSDMTTEELGELMAKVQRQLSKRQDRNPNSRINEWKNEVRGRGTNVTYSRIRDSTVCLFVTMDEGGIIRSTHGTAPMDRGDQRIARNIAASQMAAMLGI